MAIFIIILIMLLILCIYSVGNYFFSIAFDRQNTWFSEKGHAMMNTDWAEERTPTVEDTTYNQQLAIGDVFYDSDKWEELTVTSRDNLQLVARKIQAHNSSAPWVILVHGYRSSGKRDWSYTAKRYSDVGYNVLIPDMRALGMSEGRYIGMGYPEHFDLLQWITWITTHYPQAEIVLHGCSMGAAVVMQTLGATLPPQVKVAIADCGYSSLYAQFTYLLQNILKLPAKPVLFCANIITKLRTHYSLKDTDALQALANNTLPILFIHGDNDGFVPTSMVYDNQRATKGPSELLIFQGAPHFGSLYFNEARYFKAVFDFNTIYLTPFK